MIKIELIILVLFGLFSFYASQPNIDIKDILWDIFKRDQNKTYVNSTEESLRKKIWQTAYDLIQNHNQKANNRI